MTPGRELDAIVAEKVMGYRFEPGDPASIEAAKTDHTQPYLVDRWYMTGITYIEKLPKFSTDIAAAWAVFEHLHKQDPDMSFSLHYFSMGDGCDEDKWTVGIKALDMETHCDRSAPTAQLAICLAALKAVGVEV